MAVVDEGCLLLVQRGRDPGRGLWAVPGGKVRLGEPMKVAARREGLEETGGGDQPSGSVSTSRTGTT